MALFFTLDADRVEGLESIMTFRRVWHRPCVKAVAYALSQMKAWKRCWGSAARTERQQGGRAWTRRRRVGMLSQGIRCMAHHLSRRRWLVSAAPNKSVESDTQLHCASRRSVEDAPSGAMQLRAAHL